MIRASKIITKNTSASKKYCNCRGFLTKSLFGSNKQKVMEKLIKIKINNKQNENLVKYNLFNILVKLITTADFKYFYDTIINLYNINII